MFFFQALCKEDIAALKSRLQRIKKSAEEITGAASSASISTLSPSASPAGSAPNNATPSVRKTGPPLASDAKALKLTVAHAKELAAKAQRRKEEREAEKSKEPETQAQDR